MSHYLILLQMPAAPHSHPAMLPILFNRPPLLSEIVDGICHSVRGERTDTRMDGFAQLIRSAFDDYDPITADAFLEEGSFYPAAGGQGRRVGILKDLGKHGWITFVKFEPI